jgi:hypothetical protein
MTHLMQSQLQVAFRQVSPNLAGLKPMVATRLTAPQRRMLRAVVTVGFCLRVDGVVASMTWSVRDRSDGDADQRFYRSTGDALVQMHMLTETAPGRFEPTPLGRAMMAGRR